MEIIEDENGNFVIKYIKSLVMFICSDKSIKLKDGKLVNIVLIILDYINVVKLIEMDEELLIER